MNNFEIKKTVSANEMLTASRSLMKSSKLICWYFRFAGVGFIFLSIVPSFLIPNTEFFVEEFILGVVLLLLPVLASFVITKIGMKQAVNSLGGDSMEVHYQFEEDKITMNIVAPHSKSELVIMRNQMKKMKSCPTAIIVYLDKKQPIALYGNESEQKQMLEWFNQKVI